MIPLLAALAVALTPGCDLEHPSGKPGCTRAQVDALPMTAQQTIGTHNSYKVAISPAEMSLIRASNARTAAGLDYSHPPLTVQLDAGARVIELDVASDPHGGLFADPLGPKMAARAGLTAPPYDAAPMRQPGLKVLHAQDIDYRSTCALFTDCLKEIRAWSRAHPDHLPILITFNLKDDDIPVPGSAHALKFDAAAMDELDAEIRSVLSPRDLITPDNVQGRHASLREAVLAGGWPTIGKARGKIFFAMDEEGAKIALYRGARHSLEGRVAFVNTDEASPAAAYLTLNEPIEQAARISADVKAGFFVRTRADADTVEARANDTRRREAAFASGAQAVSTDYMVSDPPITSYQVTLPGGGVGRLNPVSGGH